MDKIIIKTTIVILIVILLAIAIPIIHKSIPFAQENKYDDYPNVLISLRQTKKIGIYLKGGMNITKIETGEEKIIPEGIINTITDYEEVEYFINLIKDSPLITHEFYSALVAPSERLYMYDENNEELLWIETKDKIIEIVKDKKHYYLTSIHHKKIDEFLEKYISYDF